MRSSRALAAGAAGVALSLALTAAPSLAVPSPTGPVGTPGTAATTTATPTATPTAAPTATPPPTATPTAAPTTAPPTTAPPTTAPTPADQPFRRANGTMITTGVALHSFSLRDDRGLMTGRIVTVNLSRTSVRVDHVASAAATTRAPLTTLAGQTVAAINGDFFDIDDTGAARGISKSPTRGLLQAPTTGWNNAFFMTPAGRVGIGPLTVDNRILEFPSVRVSGLNTPTVAADSVGVYSDRWGATVNADSVTGGDRDMRTVVVAATGRVVLNAPTVTRSVPRGGYVLVGRGAAVAQLLTMPPGTVVTPRSSVNGNPALVVGGSGLLLRGGAIANRADTTLAPRTFIAYDRDANLLFLVVIDGRSTMSRGATHLEAAGIAQLLGAEEAINMDGGGSTTMLAYVAGKVRVANRPSDGSLRPIANGVALYLR